MYLQVVCSKDGRNFSIGSENNRGLLLYSLTWLYRCSPIIHTYLTYFNEFVWNRTQAYKYLADSNIDWGQSSIQLSQYLTDHPDAIFEPQNIQAGH